MTELPDLPPHRPLQRPVPHDGLRSAVAAGRRRRHRFLSVTGGTTTAFVLVVLAALTLPGEQREDSLRFASPEAGVTSSASAQPGPAAGSSPAVGSLPVATGTPTPAGPPAVGTSADPTQPPPSTAPPGVGPSQQSPPSASGEARPTSREAYTEMPRDTAAPVVCQAPPDVVVSSASGCATGDSSAGTVARGGRVSGTYGLCVPSRGQPATLGFAGGQEHEVTVFDGEGGPVVYRFSATRDYPQETHERQVAQGRCLEWTGVWDTTMTGGGNAPAGTYRVRVAPTPSTINGRATAPGDGGSFEFTVTVTE